MKGQSWAVTGTLSWEEGDKCDSPDSKQVCLSEMGTMSQLLCSGTFCLYHPRGVSHPETGAPTIVSK